MDKAAIRDAIHARLEPLPHSDFLVAAQAIQGHLTQFNPFSVFHTLCGFCHLKDELDLRGFYQAWLDAGKDLYFPRFFDNSYIFAKVTSLQEFTIGKFGILEPPSSAPTLLLNEAQISIEAWLIPGVAFDKMGNRLGRGYGYYDRFLEKARGLKVGVCLDGQVVDEAIPTDEHDQAMTHLVTPGQVYWFQG